MTNLKAVVLGGTGLIGNELIHLLADHKLFGEIRILGRRNTGLESGKIHFHQVDMEHIAEHGSLFGADVVFCCLGTTMKTAGSKEAFRKVDYNMVVDAAHIAEGKIRQFIMISSLGAKATSSNFYLRTKGEAENAVIAANIDTVHILRPSILYGDRKEKRGGEKIGIAFMKMMSPLMLGSLKKYRGNEASNVAKAMVCYSLQSEKGKFIHEPREIDADSKNLKILSV